MKTFSQILDESYDDIEKRMDIFCDSKEDKTFVQLREEIHTDLEKKLEVFHEEDVFKSCDNCCCAHICIIPKENRSCLYFREIPYDNDEELYEE